MFEEHAENHDKIIKNFILTFISNEFINAELISIPTVLEHFNMSFTELKKLWQNTF